MSKYYLLILSIVSIITLTNCQQKPSAPEWLLPDEKMQNVLIDLYTEEAIIIDQRLPHNESTKKFLEARAKVFQKHQVDSTLYQNTYNYYLTNDQDKLSQIYKVVVDTLLKRKDLANTFR
ncbi:MAG: DUF4296 domain-containing protein [Flammeovirgaceae bacterium]|nr:DUF4296 domain-containing protein [Flammeovirgaceae bacterium]MDW8288141.1 DUF4296 domain-containing protein [Flammeovirgaceae bacterium]